jgi:hypothetical protein
MRAALITAVLALGIATRALAQPPIVIPETTFFDHGASHLPPADGNTYQPPQLGHGTDAPPPSGHPRLSLGPLSFDMGSSDFGKDGFGKDSRHTHYAHVHLDDVHVLGGDVSGTFDGRAATIGLSWPTAQ